MLATIHRLGSQVRNSSLLREQTWLWNTVEPAWQWAFGVLTKPRGYSTRIAEDVFRLDYGIGARYDRQSVRAYEPTVYRPFTQEIGPDMTVFDIGAHVGIFSLAAAQRVGTKGKVFAVEPAPEAIKILKRHIHVNGWDERVEVIEAVMLDTVGEVPFYVHGVSMANSLARENADVLNPERERFDAPADVISVRCVTLDAFCEQRNVEPDVIKIDVEGAELAVLKGGRQTLTRGHAKVFCEIHPDQMQSCGGSVQELQSYLAELGYEIIPLDEPNSIDIFHSRLVYHSERQCADVSSA
jgi:FkbM family methyltransferase